MNRSSAALILMVMVWVEFPASPSSASVRRMFVTSATGTAKLQTWSQAGGLSGLAAGDAICQALATAAGLEGAGDFIAWLSTEIGDDAYCRVAGFSGRVDDNCGQTELPDAGPWVRTDGLPFSDKLSLLVLDGGRTLYPPSIDENGNQVEAEPIFTATTSQGKRTLANSACADWTVETAPNRTLTGASSAGSTWWTDYHPGALGTSCSSVGRLYCFQKGSGSPLPEVARPGAFMFVTSESGVGNLSLWPRSGGTAGLPGADLVCQSLAADARLPAPQSFVAYLSDDATAAIDRILTDGPFRRPNGVRIAESRPQLASGVSTLPVLLADVQSDEHGAALLGFVATGTDASGLASVHHCLGWTNSDHGPFHITGIANESRSSWVDNGTTRHCDIPLRFYCVSNVVTIFADGLESGTFELWSEMVP